MAVFSVNLCDKSSGNKLIITHKSIAFMNKSRSHFEPIGFIVVLEKFVLLCVCKRFSYGKVKAQTHQLDVSQKTIKSIAQSPSPNKSLIIIIAYDCG